MPEEISCEAYRTPLIEMPNYLYTNVSFEIMHFQHKTSPETMSTKNIGILYYTGRILPQNINKLHLSDVSIDLSMSSFCVPLLDQYPPLAYAVINEVLWYDDDGVGKNLQISTLRCYWLMTACTDC